MYKHIVFDFGGVFLSLKNPHTKTLDTLAKALDVEVVKIMPLWYKHRNEVVTDQVSTSEFVGHVISTLQIERDVKRAHGRWARNYRSRKSQINWGLVSYSKKLRKKYAVHMLSDTIGIGVSTMWEKELLRNFDVILRSHEQGVKKPDKEAFLNMLKKIGARPNECIFVDDMQENVDAAKRLGITAVRFTTLAKLKDDLARLGIAL